MSRTPDPEVGDSSPTRVKPCCVLEKGTFTPPKVLAIPRKRWLHPNMTEKLFTGMLRINQPTNQPASPLEVCLSTAKPGSRQSHPCCPEPTLVASIAIAGGPQQTTVVPSHHYGGPQLTLAQHPCRHNNNLMVLCLTHQSTQEVLSQPLYPSQHSVGLQPTTVTITDNLLVLSLHM